MRKHAEKELLRALDKDQLSSFRSTYLNLHTYDQSQFFIEQTKENRLLMYHYLSPAELAVIMEHIDPEKTATFFTEMDTQLTALVFSEMAADDAVDVLTQLDEALVTELLTLIEAEPAEDMKHLLHYEEKTAGSIMTTEYVAVLRTQTAAQALQHLKQVAPIAETIYYLYILNFDQSLAGVLSLRDLLIADEAVLVEDIMDEQVISVSAGRGQRKVGQLIQDYNLLAIPVVDYRQHLLGIITVDDILDVMEEEASEDYTMLAAVSDPPKPTDTALIAAKKRLPWLIILLFLGMFTASLIGRFEDTIGQLPLLAMFIPLIAGMAGNTGTQSLAVAVRGLATGEYGKQSKLKLMMRETLTGLITGATCGVLITLVIFIWKGELFLGALVGISIMATLTVATLSGSIIPIFIDRLNIDPAVASGPFITTLNDIISIVIYFGIATTFMSYLL